MYFNYKDFSIYYEKHGNSYKSILILPGWGNTRNTFYNMIDYFKSEYSVYILDYPGFGLSKSIHRELDIFDYTYVIYSFIKELKLNNCIIIAHSFGGRIISLLQGYFKLEFNKIVLIDVAGIKRRKNLNSFIREKTYKFLKRFGYLLPKKYKYKYRKKLINYFGSNDYKSIPNYMRKTFVNIINKDLRKYYKYINNALIIWGGKDYDTPIIDSLLLNKIISNSSLVILNNGSHFSYLDYPYLINTLIDEYIKKSMF